MRAPVVVLILMVRSAGVLRDGRLRMRAPVVVLILMVRSAGEARASRTMAAGAISAVMSRCELCDRHHRHF
jgi:hypothetical protein